MVNLLMDRSPVHRAPQWAGGGWDTCCSVCPQVTQTGAGRWQVKVGADWEELHGKQCSAEQLGDKNDRWNIDQCNEVRGVGGNNPALLF